MNWEVNHAERLVLANGWDTITNEDFQRIFEL